MAQQVPLAETARADEIERDGTREIASDLAYRRLLMVNVVFYGAAGAGDRNWVLVDAGVVGTKALIKAAAEARFGTDARPAAIVLTHGHFDHVGALADLSAEWEVPVYAHDLEHPYLDGRAAYPTGDAAVGGGLLTSLSPLYPTRPVDVSSRLWPLPADGSLPGMPGWRWLHTPGHTPGHVSLWREADATLIAGDAIVTTAPESVYATALQTPELHGPPLYFTIDWDRAARSVALLAALNPALIVTGHGRAMQGPDMNAALQALTRDFATLAVPEQGRYLDRPAVVEDGSAYRVP